MIKFYFDYYWKTGKPIGIQEIDPKTSLFAYKIIPDPYHRRFSIEKYKYGRFDRIIYDSFLLDFRHMKSIEQLAWKKETLIETEETSTSVLRNHDDRSVLVEKYFFEKNLCRRCEIYSIHGVLIAVNQMYYEVLQDSFNGLILFDVENHPIMMKKYEIDPISKEFTNLISEQWDMLSGFKGS